MKKEPLVSICVPNYNKERYIREAIESILNQTYNNFELIIVDNASTDNSMDVIKSFNDPRISVYRNDRNIGSVKNWNKSLEYAKGDYIAVFHSDDIYHKQLVEFETKALSTLDEAGIASCGRADNKDDFKKSQNEDMNSDGEYYTPLNFLKFLFGGSTLVNMSVMMKRECYELFGKYNEALFETVDQDYYFRVASKYGLVFFSQNMVFKREKPCPNSVEYHKRWIRGYEALKGTARIIYNTSAHKDELEKLYTHFIATQDRNSYRRSLLIEDYAGARKYLLLYLRNMVKFTRDNELILWLNPIDKLVKPLYADGR